MKKKKIKKQMKDLVVVVSGIPRSGTSMMMQMLDAGGLELLTDKKRKADGSNPKGYYEHDAVKKLEKSNEIIHEAKGKAVKVISFLLNYLPSDLHY
ncbi:MAG: hypothetical protein EU548_05200, partial [Promethearchaeota archaeon]